jgi:hypothetical protein
MRIKDIKFMALHLVIRGVFPHPFTKKNQQLGEMDSILFKRHPVFCMRTPEGISATRMKILTLKTISKLFDIYEFELRKLNYPNRI